MNDEEDETRRPFLARPSTYVVATLLVVAAVLAAVAFLPSDDQGEERAGATAPATEERLPVPSEQGSGGDVDPLGRPVVVPANIMGSPLRQTEKTSPASPRNPLPKPEGLQWQRVFGTPAPFTSSDGPSGLTEAGVPVGISRTPVGAVIGVLQAEARVRFGTRSTREATVRQLLTGGDKDEIAELLDTGDAMNTGLEFPEVGLGPAQEHLVPAAVRIRPGNWSKDAATVDLAYGPQRLNESDDEPSYGWRSASVVWAQDHWQLKFSRALLDVEDNIVGTTQSLDSGEWATWV